MLFAHTPTSSGRRRPEPFPHSDPGTAGQGRGRAGGRKPKLDDQAMAMGAGQTAESFAVYGKPLDIVIALIGKNRPS